MYYTPMAHGIRKPESDATEHSAEKVKLTISVAPDLRHSLKVYAAITQRDMQDVVCEAVEQYLAEERRKRIEAVR